MIQYLDEKLEQNQEIDLGVFWIYGPASEFYQLNFSPKKIRKIFRLKDADFKMEREFDFIYIRLDQVDQVKNKYVLEKEFGKSGVLLKKKN